MDDQKTTDPAASSNPELQHDQPIMLRPTDPTPSPTFSEPSVQLPAPQPVITPEQSQPTVPMVDPAPATAPAALQSLPPAAPEQPGFSPADSGYEPQPFMGSAPELTWQSSEFLDHTKSTKWYAVYALASVVGVGFGYLVTREVITIVFLVLAAVLFGIMAGRKPRRMSYGLGDDGVYVGNKFYPFADFNAFGFSDEGSILSINFLPLKRFSPVLTIACEPENGEDILEFISNYLPYSRRGNSVVDGLMHRIRF